MKIIKNSLSYILLLNIIAIALIIINTSDYNLNSIIEDYDDNIIIKEVNTGIKLLSNNIQLSSNKWTFPVSGNYVITTNYSNYHKALDIYDYNGYNSNILAANSGTIITVQNNCHIGDLNCNGKRGNYIVIKHNISNYYTVYMHLNKTYVNVGDKVSSGDIIASMGNTGNVIPVPTNSNPYAGTHLHFCLFVGEPYNGGYAINPYRVY